MADAIKCVFTPNNILFVTQVVCIFIVVCVSLLNLTLEIGNQHLWTMILTSSLAFLMPSPKFKTVEPDPKNIKAKETVTIETN